MSVFYRDIDVNISDYKSELSKPLIVYERDRGLEIYFNLIRYAYRFDKNPSNLLENLVGAYATVTLVNPSGYEIGINEVEITEDAKVKFVITEDLTDELTEIGIYQLQIHVNNDVEGRDTSVFSVPPFNFEVRERLKGRKNELLDSEGNGLTDKEGYQLVSATSNKIINFSADKINEYLNSIPTIQGKIKVLNSQLEHIIQKDNSIVINPKFPPEGYAACKMDGVSDDTQAFQSLINNFSNIALPEGILRFTHLTLNSNTRITGLGINKTILKPLKSNDINAITLSVGPNVDIYLDNFSLIGNDENLIQNGLCFNATASVESPYHGGLWLSRFSNIVIKNFKGTQLVLSAGSNGLLPHQGLVFERVECNAHANVTTSKALTIQGQVEQILWLQCAFSGEGSDIVSEFITTIDGDVGGGSQTFLQCYFGNGKTGVKLERSKYIKFSNCYFENLEVGHTSNKSCEHIIFENGNYQLVTKCHNGVDSTSEILLYKNVLVGSTILIDGWGVFTHKDNQGCNVVVNERRDRSIEQNQIIVDSLYTRVNNSETLLNLSSKVLYDEILLTAWNSNGFIINTGGNIDVKNSITINHLETVILKRISDKWIIISKTL